MNARMMAAAGLAAMVLVAGGTSADVFNMGGTRNADGSWMGLASLETVPVGNPGNAGELSGAAVGAGGYGPDRICGAVDYVYNIGKYEVTAAQYTEFLNKVSDVDTYGLYNPSMWSGGYGCKIERFAGAGTAGDPYQYRVASDWANRPVNYVSWGDAARFANWLHNGQPTGAQGLSTTEDGAYFLNGAISDAALLGVTREADWKWAIPTEDEWYKAAYYKGGSTSAGYWDYPTSSDSDPSKNEIDPDPGNNATFLQSEYSPYHRTEVGTHENSDSPYGTFDQGGNVWEWNEAIPRPLVRGLRGGGFVANEDCMLASYRYDSQTPTEEAYEVGFRVSEVPEPASVVLLALGGIGTLLRRTGIRR